MSKWTHSGSGYVGCCDNKAEAELHVQLLESCGIKAIARTLNHDYDNERFPDWSYHYRTFSLWTSPAEALRAREVRRGFKVAMTLKGDPFDFVTGLRAGLLLREKEKQELLVGRAVKLLGGPQ